MAGDKIETLLETHDLTEFGERLVTWWTRDDDANRYSVRDLTREFNTKLVTEALHEYADGVAPADHTPEDLVTTLRARVSDAEKYDDITAGTIADVEAWFDKHDIPIDAVTEDLVSYGTMHSYLKDKRGASLPDSSRDAVTPPEQLTPSEVQEKRLDRIGTYRDTFRQYTEAEFDTLQDWNLTPDVTPDVYIEIYISCPNCGARYTATEYIEQQGCTTCNTHTRGKPTTYQASLSDTTTDDTDTPRTDADDNLVVDIQPATNTDTDASGDADTATDTDSTTAGTPSSSNTSSVTDDDADAESDAET